MKLFAKRKDGGPQSTVTGYWLVEIKSLFSVALLRFDHGTRINYHSHAFNSISWLLKGELVESTLNGPPEELHVFGSTETLHSPALRPIITRRNNFHRVKSEGVSWVLTFRGPWAKRWLEYDPELAMFYWLEDRRRIVKSMQAGPWACRVCGKIDSCDEHAAPAL